MLIDGDCDPYLALSTWGMPPAWLLDRLHCLIHVRKGVRGRMENLKEKFGCAMLNLSWRDRYITELPPPGLLCWMDRSE